MPGGVGNAGQVVRVGDTVRRPVGPQTPAVESFLKHLEHKGFAGAPRHLGYEDAREVLTYVPGDVAHHDPPPDWCATDAVLVSVVTLLRGFHDAARGFEPPPDAAWAWPPPVDYAGDLVCHNDVCRENVVFRDGTASALIDFDFAAPATPVWDVASLVRHWVLALPGDRRARTQRVAETYPVDLAELSRALLARLDWGLAMVKARADAGEPGFVEMWNSGSYERNRALHAWVVEHLPHGLDER